MLYYALVFFIIAIIAAAAKPEGTLCDWMLLGLEIQAHWSELRGAR